MVYNERLGFVDISAPCADVCASIMLHMLVARKFRIVDDLGRSSATHVHCTCAAVMCSKMGTLTLGISHIRHILKTNYHAFFTHGVKCESWLNRHLHTICKCAHPVQGMHMRGCHVFQDCGSAAGHYTHKAQTKTSLHDANTHGMHCQPWFCSHLNTRCRRL